MLPINSTYVQKVIEKERPDSIMLSFGGQTALNCGVSLEGEGILNKYGIRVLGTQIESIRITEDRKLFKEAMQKSGVPVLPSAPAYSLSEARKIAKEIGFPVIIRVAYTLGGKGGGVAYNEYELEEIVQRGLTLSVVRQVLIEKYVGSWKQIEYEIMRDSHGNNAVVCNMENVLAMRVHTGDNIVVTPSQTLNNIEYHRLRSAAQRAASQCNIVGECNIQFGLDPTSEQYCAIEINARLSRSSALASKATGYPLAYMAAKIGLGYTLPELVNRITKVTTACFEPSLDYITLKMPRWDFQKFEGVKRRLGSTMKSVGEVMAIGRNFEEVIQKAIRMCDIDKDGLTSCTDNNEIHSSDEIERIEQSLLQPDDGILFTVVRALRAGIDIHRINQLSHIDPWFLLCINNIIRIDNRLRKETFDESLILEAKKTGFSDKQIASCMNIAENQVRSLRNKFGIRPRIKQIDTLAAEWPAKTNYLYMTYDGDGDDVEFDKMEKSTIVLGAGPYRIGSSVEFDWATVNMVWGLKENGVTNVSVINCNPETVSTDYDISDRLYFEELTFERVMDIYEREMAYGIVTCVGGQVANNLTPKLSEAKVKIIGTSSENVDRAEDRVKFGKLLDTLNIKQPAWKKFSDVTEAKKFAKRVGYPVLVRPSYVLSGAAMKVVWAEHQFEQFLASATSISTEHPVVISKFIQDAAEVEVDAVSGMKSVIIGSIIEHIDNAGIHSGDAIMCIPPWRQDRKTLETIKEYSLKIGQALNVEGPFNIQYLVKNEEVFVIEANVRASRSMPFVSKFIEANLIGLSARAMMNRDLPESARDLWWKTTAFGIKVPQFSFMQLEGADIVLGVEMHSTGEVACFGNSFYDALSKAYLAAGYSLPQTGSALISVGGQKNKDRLRPLISLISSLRFEIMATEHTAEFLESNLVRPVQKVYKISEPDRNPNIADLLFERRIDFIINIPSTSTIEKYVGMLYDEYLIRRKAVEMGVPVLTTIEGATSFVKTLEWLASSQPTVDHLKPYKRLG
jgi:carbamoyl-phosphate synthase large subunit